MLQLVEEALLDDRILSSTVLTKELVGQHARKCWLRIRCLAIRLHAFDAPSLLSVPRKLYRLLYLLQFSLNFLRSTVSANKVTGASAALKSLIF
jgi:hypothetical protein